MNQSLQRIYRAALAHHQAGRLSLAEELYLRVIADEPNTAHALHLLGVIAQRRGCLEEAEQWVRKAISALGGPVAEFYNTLGAVLKARGELAAAVAPFQEAILLRPDYVEAHQDLGRTLLALDRLEEAEGHFEKVLQLSPGAAAAHHDMGNLFMQRKMPAEAKACFEKTIKLDPGHAQAWNNLGALLYGEGEPAGDRKLLDEAWACFEKATKLDPRTADVWNNLGGVLYGQGQRAGDGKLLDEAWACFEKAVQLDPQHAEAWNNMGTAQGDQGRFADAVDSIGKAIALKPGYAAAHSNLGVMLKAQGRFSEAIPCFDKAFELDPNLFVARWNRCLTLFLLGQIERAWTEYETGWLHGLRKRQRPFCQPRWDGSPLTGKRLLFWGEQGVGDEIIWAGMIPELGERHIVECEPRLVPLFVRSFPGVEVIPRMFSPHPATAQADLQIPAGSAGRWLRASLDQFPRHHGYLRADPERVAYWRRRLDSLGPGLTIGIGWRSSDMTGMRALSYADLQQWGPVLSVPGVHFINLQYDECRAELEQARARFGVPIHELSGIDLRQDLDDVAALIAAMDLVVSNVTTVANIAGALGKPAWVMEFTCSSDWLTMGQHYIPWFPSVRLYGRAWDQSWDDVLERISQDLAGLASCQAAVPDEARTLTALLPTAG